MLLFCSCCVQSNRVPYLCKITGPINQQQHFGSLFLLTVHTKPRPGDHENSDSFSFPFSFPLHLLLCKKWNWINGRGTVAAECTMDNAGAGRRELVNSSSVSSGLTVLFWFVLLMVMTVCAMYACVEWPGAQDHAYTWGCIDWTHHRIRDKRVSLSLLWRRHDGRTIWLPKSVGRERFLERGVGVMCPCKGFKIFMALTKNMRTYATYW